MTTWAERMHRSALTFSHVVTSCGHPNMPYPRRLDKVKFGVPLDEVCKNDIPGSLLVLILKLNKEAPTHKDVFRAPGHQANMKKLIHFLQTGRLVNIDNFSVYTIASVLKKFLRKLPGGIFGPDGEQELFEVIKYDSIDDQRERIQRLMVSLPCYTQRLLVLLFGTFRAIAYNAERYQTGMTSEALGVSVAPSFFHTCVSNGKQARMEDVARFKAEVSVATRIMKLMIDNFGASTLFSRTNYEYYARLTGRILKFDGDWIIRFSCQPHCNLAGSQQEESQSTPALIHVSDYNSDTCSNLGRIPENNLLESCTRLSISLEESILFKGSSRSSSSSTSHQMTLDELRAVNHYAESTKSLSFLPQPNSGLGLLPDLQSVHERQTARMRTRSEWFLSPFMCKSDGDRPSLYYLRTICNQSSSSDLTMAGPMLSASAESVQKRPSVRRSRNYAHRTSSKRNKENGSKKWKKSHEQAASTAPAECERALKDGANTRPYSPGIQRKCKRVEVDSSNCTMTGDTADFHRPRL